MQAKFDAPEIDAAAAQPERHGHGYGHDADADADDIARWRARVFATLMPIVLLLGAIAAVPSVPLMLAQGKWPVALMDVAALAWIVAIWRLERLPYRLRVLHFMAILYMVAIGLMLTVGPVSLTYLMAPPAMAVILLGNGAAIGALALSAGCIAVLGTLGLTSVAMPGIGGGAALNTLVVAINFTCVGALITFTGGTLIKGLARSLHEARTAAASLEAGQAALRAANAELGLTSEAIARLNDMVLIAHMVDTPGAEQPVIFANHAFLRHTGYAREEIIGRSVRLLIGADTDPATVARVAEAVERRQPVSTELVCYTRAGTPFWMQVEMVPFAGDSGAITHWVVVGRDVTDARNAADAIHRLAFYDGLTGLPNRRLLMERLGALARAARDGAGLGAVLYVDLDNFKSVNDARGHATGDDLLRQAAARLGAVTEAQAGTDGTVARLGGDEFVVLAGRLGQDPQAAAERALALAEQLRAALAETMTIDGQRYYATSSIGVALTAPDSAQRQHPQTVHDLLREADTAMYHAKARGRNGVARFEPGMLGEAERRLTLERDLAHALDNGELALHFQLQVDGERHPCGAELLMRWRRADGSSVPPDVFIPVAEASGQIVALGEWALRQACVAWHALDAAGFTLPLSVNVSPVQFRQPDFVARVGAILKETGAPPGQLIFEVTEGLLVDRLDQTIARMHALASLGIRISIDDFGTGYSSLAYLTRMPLYELKIDKSFIRDTPLDHSATSIVQSVLAMAGHLGLRVVAEGVETEAQAAWLGEHGNASMQGWLFQRPAPLDTLLAQLGTYKRDIEAQQS